MSIRSGRYLWSEGISSLADTAGEGFAIRGWGAIQPVAFAVGVGRSRRGFGTRCWLIRLPRATRAFPICPLVPWIVAMRGLLDLGVDLATEMRAPENSVASRRP